VKKYKKVFKNTVKAAKQMFNNRYIETAVDKSKAVWSVVKSELGIVPKSRSPAIQLYVENNSVSEPEVLANIFNTHFTKSASEDRVSCSLSNALSRTKSGIRTINSQFSFQTVTESDIARVIMSLKNNKSVGWDDIPIFVIKKSVHILSRVLCCLVNFSLRRGEFPELLKLAVVTPVFKKGDRGLLENYRPISVLPVFSKIFEKIVNRQLMRYLTTNNLLTNSQYGFIKGKCTEDAVAHFINTISQTLDERKSAAGIFCDLSKAFDSIDHKILLGKMEIYGILGNELQWFDSYFSRRKQKTQLKRDGRIFESTWKSLDLGVPQGTILGPTLFLIYINDLPRHSTDDLILFADDTTAIIRQNNAQELLNHIPSLLRCLTTWFADNGLSLNDKKTSIIHFSLRSPGIPMPPLLFEKSYKISFKDSAKFLGIHVDSKLCWQIHIQHVISRLNSICFALSVLRRIVSLETLKTVYYGYFFPIMKYGIIVWGTSSKSIKIFRIQKRALRIMCNVSYRSSCRRIFEDLNILTFPSLLILEMLCYVHKNLHMFETLDDNHNYRTRNRHLLLFPTHRSQFYERSPYYMGIKLYNKIPINFRNLNLHKFREIMKKHLLTNVFYSSEEFMEASIQF
jgi:hypothetical protein